MKVNLGGGPDWQQEGWRNLDWPQVDLRRGLPDDVQEIELIYTSHMLEHLQFTDVMKLLDQCRKRMVTDAGIRIVVPDMDLLAEMVRNGDPMGDLVRNNPRYYAHRISQGYDFHIAGLAAFDTSIKHLTRFTYSILYLLLDHLGFCDIEQLRYGVSRYEELCETATLNAKGGPLRGFDNPETESISVYVEAGV